VLAGSQVILPLEEGASVSVYDLELLTAGTILPLLFGWLSAVRPSMVTTLMHPEYKVRRAAEHLVLRISCVRVKCEHGNVQGPCLHANCLSPDECTGNRLFWDERGKLSVEW
jgi:hypothetical protein